jgi:hypothetical protein
METCFTEILISSEFESEITGFLSTTNSLFGSFFGMLQYELTVSISNRMSLSNNVYFSVRPTASASDKILYSGQILTRM